MEKFAETVSAMTNEATDCLRVAAFAESTEGKHALATAGKTPRDFIQQFVRLRWAGKLTADKLLGPEPPDAVPVPRLHSGSRSVARR